MIFRPLKRVEEPEDLLGGRVHVKGVNCSVSGPSTSNVQLITLGNVSGEQDNYV